MRVDSGTDDAGTSTGGGGASLASRRCDRGIAGATRLGVYGAQKTMGAGAKWRGDHDELT
jgi:hypothetical protein